MICGTLFPFAQQPPASLTCLPLCSRTGRHRLICCKAQTDGDHGASSLLRSLRKLSLRRSCQVIFAEVGSTAVLLVKLAVCTSAQSSRSLLSEASQHRPPELFGAYRLPLSLRTVGRSSCRAKHLGNLWLHHLPSGASLKLLLLLYMPFHSPRFLSPAQSALTILCSASYIVSLCCMQGDFVHQTGPSGVRLDRAPANSQGSQTPACWPPTCSSSGTMLQTHTWEELSSDPTAARAFGGCAISVLTGIYTSGKQLYIAGAKVPGVHSVQAGKCVSTTPWPPRLLMLQSTGTTARTV